MKLSKSLEDYLESVLFLQEDDSQVRLTDISQSLGVTKPSATKAIKKLEELGFVEHENYGGVFLTPRGKLRAQEIKKKHYLLRRFLTDVLGVGREAAEIDACKLEHAISDQTSDKLNDFLDFLDNSGKFRKEVCQNCYADWVQKIKA